jgi:hypothetical protein
MQLDQKDIEFLLKSDVQVNYLRKYGKRIHEGTPEKIIIEELISEALRKNIDLYDVSQKEYLSNMVLRSIGRTKTGETQILDSKDYEPWLNDNSIPLDKDRKIAWLFFDDYRDYLTIDKGWSENLFARTIDRDTTQILNRLMDPKKKGRWGRKGMVVGNVQSGKTGNYTGLISKSIDAGYKIIIVLAGLHNSLRLQTQQRLDKELVGFDTGTDDNNNRKTRIGVGAKKNHLNDSAEIKWITYADPSKGDFNLANAYQGEMINSSMKPIILTVKKNKYILENVIKWLKMRGLDEDSDVIDSIPLLLIDDECDNASVNTKPDKKIQKSKNSKKEDDGINATAINRCIRELLNLFGQTGYIGYTATPYANMLIPRDNKELEEIALDLFPSNFIIQLDAPLNYIGPKEIFGLKEIKEIDQHEFNAFPLVREDLVNGDYKSFIMDGHKADFEIQGGLPRSLKEAIHAFILSCAVRIERKQSKEHSSMLIHVTRFVKVQQQVFDLVDEYLVDLRSSIRNGDIEIISLLQKLWTDDFIGVSFQMEKNSYGLVHSFDDIKKHFVTVMEDIGVPLQINGEAGDILEYEIASKKSRGITVIAIGGDKLSRGLTLEGLTISYYLRSSRMYDTLLQMGRWFGYKDGYLDLCRIYTTSELSLSYQHIASVNLELENEFKSMTSDKLEPEKFGMKVRSHSGLLEVTSINKRRSGSKRKITFSGLLAKLTYLSIDQKISRSNAKIISSLFNDAPAESIFRLNKDKSSSEVGFGIKSKNGINNYEKIIGFLNDFDSLQNSKGSSIAKYIKIMATKHSELKDWTILVVSPPSNDAIDLSLKNLPFLRPVIRNETKETVAVKNTKIDWSKKQMSFSKGFHSASDLTSDLNEKELEYIGYSAYKSRKARSPKKGLLCIYPIIGRDVHKKSTGEFPIFAYAIDFPESTNAEKLEYVIDQILQKEIEQ